LETAKAEVERFFKPEELFEYEDIMEAFLYSAGERG
jgi:hypothetical protein